MSASAVGREEGDKVVIRPREVAGKGKQDGGTTVPAAHPDPRPLYLLLPPLPCCIRSKILHKMRSTNEVKLPSQKPAPILNSTAEICTSRWETSSLLAVAAVGPRGPRQLGDAGTSVQPMCPALRGRVGVKRGHL